MARLVVPGRDKQTPLASTGPLRVTVVNGDLSFISQPLLIGHYRSLRLTGTERVMNNLIGGTMAAAQRLGLYPVDIGTHQVFMNHKADPENPWRLPRPEAVIVAGLGEEGKLRAEDLVQTVRQATIAWAQHAIENRRNPEDGAQGKLANQDQFELAATLIGSGGSGISAGQSAQAIAQAVREANDRLAQNNEDIRTLNGARKNGNNERLSQGWPIVAHLYLIELYLDRAREAWRALQVQAQATTGYNLTEIVQHGHAALPRPIESDYRGADYDFMSAVSGTDSDGVSVISYTLDTKRARSEVRAQAAEANLLREYLQQGWTETQNAQNLGRTLFKLLIPVEMESFLSGSSEMQIELDSGTAGIPWELLDSGSDDPRNPPWSIRAKLLRKLRTADFKEQPRDAAVEDDILVVGEPRCDTTIYPRLRAARHEATTVRELFAAVQDINVSELISPDDEKLPGPDACEITSKLMNSNWRIVHIAGHGEPPLKAIPKPQKPDDPPQRPGNPRGVVLSNGLFLGSTLIGKMRPVPELVFVNCCHLAARDAQQLLRGDPVLGRPYDRASFASGVAEALINLGVRCVIAAGWAVGDKQAEAFATTFYRELLNGQRFLDAVGRARAAAKELGGNTWAAYQCYGDPDWMFRRGPADPQRPRTNHRDEFSGIASSTDLRVALETLAVQTNFRKADRNQQSDKIKFLEDRFGERWKDNGAIAEAFGKAYAAVKKMPEAIRWYQNALAANDGGASLKTVEQLGNLRVRLAEEAVNAADKDPRKTTAELQEIIEKARGEIAEARQSLEALATDVRATIERESMLGSAWKRTALIERIAGDSAKEMEAIERMRESYLRAENLARLNNHPDLFYPALNRIAAEIIINAGNTGWAGLAADAFVEVRTNLEAKSKNDPDFWSIAGLVELKFYEALALRDRASNGNGNLAGCLEDLKTGYKDLGSRVDSNWMWSSVYDQARFVLEKYAGSVTKQEEKDSATDLLHLLKKMASETSH